MKLCSRLAHHPLILKDQIILFILKKFLADDRIVVVTYLVKTKLNLSENADDALVLSNERHLKKPWQCS